MTTVTIEIKGKPVVVDLDRLTPLAASLARAAAELPTPHRGTIILESAGSLRDALTAWGRPPSDDDLARWYSSAELDAPHRIPWRGWAPYALRKHETPIDIHDYLETEARKLPIGYAPAGHSGDGLLSLDQVMRWLRDCGQGVAPGTWRGYTSRGQAPAPDRYIGRRPLWRQVDIEQWAASRPGPGARTDLARDAP